MTTRARLTEMLCEEITRAESIGLKLNPIKEEIQLCNSSRCYGYNNGVKRLALIYISKKYLTAPEEELRSVIAHEVCHSVIGSNGHDAIWRNAVHRMKQVYEYAAAEYHLNEHPYSANRRNVIHTELKISYNYACTCANCGYTIYRKKMCKFVQNPSSYRCGKCNIGKFAVISM